MEKEADEEEVTESLTLDRGKRPGRASRPAEA
jgi:hypothetical protein